MRIMARCRKVQSFPIPSLISRKKRCSVTATALISIMSYISRASKATTSIDSFDIKINSDRFQTTVVWLYLKSMSSIWSKVRRSPTLRRNQLLGIQTLDRSLSDVKLTSSGTWNGRLGAVRWAFCLLLGSFHFLVSHLSTMIMFIGICFPCLSLIGFGSTSNQSSLSNKLTHTKVLNCTILSLAARMSIRSIFPSVTAFVRNITFLLPLISMSSRVWQWPVKGHGNIRSRRWAM